MKKKKLLFSLFTIISIFSFGMIKVNAETILYGDSSNSYSSLVLDNVSRYSDDKTFTYIDNSDYKQYLLFKENQNMYVFGTFEKDTKTINIVANGTNTLERFKSDNYYYIAGSGEITVKGLFTYSTTGKTVDGKTIYNIKYPVVLTEEEYSAVQNKLDNMCTGEENEDVSKCSVYNPNEYYNLALDKDGNIAEITYIPGEEDWQKIYDEYSKFDGNSLMPDPSKLYVYDGKDDVETIDKPSDDEELNITDTSLSYMDYSSTYESQTINYYEEALSEDWLKEHIRNIDKVEYTYDEKTNSVKFTANEDIGSVLTISSSSTNFSTDSNIKLNAILTTLDGDVVNPTLTWSSEDTDIATVDQNGVVTAKKEGTVKINVTATYGGSTLTSSITLELYVKVTGIAIEQPSKTIFGVGEESVLYSKVTPKNATYYQGTWSSSEPSVITVDSRTGEIKAVGVGTATITVTSYDGGYSDSINLEVNIPIEKVDGLSSSVELDINDSTNVSKNVTVSPSNTTMDKTITWSSSDSSIASVNSNGVVTAKRSGVVVITATASNGVTATCTVSVDVPMISVSVDKSQVSMDYDTTAKVNATIYPENTTLSKELTWTSNNVSVATVDKNGKIFAKGIGQAVITVKNVRGQTATVKVTVNAVNTGKFQIKTKSKTTWTGKALTPEVTVRYQNKVLKNGTDYTIKYSNNKNIGKGIITVTGKGKYTGSTQTTFEIVPKRPTVTKIKKNVKNKTFTVYFKNLSNVDKDGIADNGIFVYYKVKGSSTWKYKTITSESDLKKGYITIKDNSLTNNKTYSVTISTFYTVGTNDKPNGPWSYTKTFNFK